jgi:hypothetical protein
MIEALGKSKNTLSNALDADLSNFYEHTLITFCF